MNTTFARSTDPWTSHEAAESITGLTEKRRAVLFILNRYGPMTDTDISFRYGQHEELPRQSASGLRTRRSELVERERVFNTGDVIVLKSNRRSIVWSA